MKWPAPTRQHHQSFCENEGWEQVRNARGKTSGHHAATYEFRLHDGRILRTRISHPPDGSTYGASIWSHILRDQLDVDEETFWACARDGVKPGRGAPPEPEAGIPAEVMHLLINRVGLSGAEITGMTRAEAIARLNRFWTEQRQ